MNQKQKENHTLRTIFIHSWSEFQEKASSPEFAGWAFRGQGDSTWHLESTLSRCFGGFHSPKNVWAHQEDRNLRIFQRKSHLFLDQIPAEDNVFEWLALMQHHGAPTRLLDFTWSPFVAAFFALEKAKADVQTPTHCAVWAINFKEVRRVNKIIAQQYPLFAEYLVAKDDDGKVPDPNEKIRDLAPRTRKKYEWFYVINSWRDRVPFIAVGEPYHMNQRLIAQSGTFVVPSILDQPVEEILAQYPDPKITIAKFELDIGMIRKEAMNNLYFMNITNATLFPSLDGMARSLNYELEHHWGFDPITGENFQNYLDSLR